MEGRILNYSVGLFLIFAIIVSFLNKTSIDSSLITIYTAKKIITMDANKPIATAVAIKKNKIYAIGSLDEMKTWMKPGSYKINNTYSDKIITPGYRAQSRELGTIAVGKEANLMVLNEMSLGSVTAIISNGIVQTT